LSLSYKNITATNLLATADKRHILRERQH